VIEIERPIIVPVQVPVVADRIVEKVVQVDREVERIVQVDR